MEWTDPIPTEQRPEPRPSLRRGRRRRERRRRRPPPIPREAVPSFFTLGNLLSGFFSIVQASQGNLEFAAWLIVFAGFFDLLDGMMARLARADSSFGVELDSLCDIVSFGVAPSFLLYQFGLKEFPFGAFLAALPAITGAVRLARFNSIQSATKTDYFVGLPIPAMAGTIVAFILTFQDDTWFAGLDHGRLSILIPLTILLAGLMVSPIRFVAPPQPTRRSLRKHPWRFVAFALGLLLVLFLQEVGLLISAVVYLFLGVGGAILWAVRVVSGKERDAGSGIALDD